MLRLREQVVGVENDQDDQQHDDTRVECADRPLVLVIGAMEAADTEDVRHDGDGSYDQTNRGTDTGSNTDDWEDEREEQIGQQAPNTRDQDRLAKQPFWLICSIGIDVGCDHNCTLSAEPERLGASTSIPRSGYFPDHRDGRA